MAKTGTHLKDSANALMEIVQDICKSGSKLSLTKDSELVERDIIEYESRMRTLGLERFNGPCYLGVVHIYQGEAQQKSHNACGALMLYLEEEAAGKLLKALGYSGFDEDNDEAVLENTAKLCEKIVERFKQDLTKRGYRDLIFAPALKYKNDAPDGVEFSYDEYKYYEASLYLWKKKTIVVSLTLIPPA